MTAADTTVPTGRTWTVQWTGERPPTANEHRTLHYRQRAKVDLAWRSTFANLARLGPGRIPPLDLVDIIVTPLHKDRRSPQDVAACAPAAKAAIDGLVDAGVIADDDPTHLRRVVFEQPEIAGVDGMRLTVVEVAQPEVD